MAIKFQYNKTFLHKLRKDLKIRENALPTLQAKESALRLEVKKAKQETKQIQKQLDEKKVAMAPTYRLWGEFPPDLLTVREVLVTTKKIAGVKIPQLDEVRFSINIPSFFAAASWYPAGVDLLKELLHLTIKKEVADKRTEILEYARKKTTQKVNLYEKVQIPGYREAILKIKRFLEDEENLAKAAQKILKERMARAEAAKAEEAA